MVKWWESKEYESKLKKLTEESEKLKDQIFNLNQDIMKLQHHHKIVSYSITYIYLLKLN